MSTTPLPSAHSPIAGTFPATPAFYRFLQWLQSEQATNASDEDFTELQNEITIICEALGSPDGTPQNIPPLSEGNYPTLQVAFPILMSGLLQDGFARLMWGGSTSDVPEGSNLYYTAARFYSALKAALIAGSNITLTPDDTAKTITIDASGGGGLDSLITDDGDAFMSEDDVDLLVA